MISSYGTYVVHSCGYAERHYVTSVEQIVFVCCCRNVKLKKKVKLNEFLFTSIYALLLLVFMSRCVAFRFPFLFGIFAIEMMQTTSFKDVIGMAKTLRS